MEQIEDTRKLLDSQLQSAVTADPLAALGVIGAVDRDLDTHRNEAVRSAIQTHSWSEIGDAMGVSRQAAHQKFAKDWAVQLKSELKAEERVMKAAHRSGDDGGVKASKGRIDALLADFKQASRYRR